MYLCCHPQGPPGAPGTVGLLGEIGQMVRDFANTHTHSLRQMDARMIVMDKATGVHLWYCED